jgi:5-methylcytosine-specific restriction enzyme A
VITLRGGFCTNPLPKFHVEQSNTNSPTKQCAKCLQFLPLHKFGRKHSRLLSRCKQCRRPSLIAKRRKWFAKNRLRIAESRRLRRYSVAVKQPHTSQPITLTCAVCGIIDQDPSFFDIDHIIPVSQGGSSFKENLQMICPNCHRRKSLREIREKYQNPQILKITDPSFFTETENSINGGGTGQMGTAAAPQGGTPPVRSVLEQADLSGLG